MIIAKYRYIKAYLQKKMGSSKNKFKSMFLEMIEKTKMYLKEAMECNIIVLATMLNPSYWLSIFQTYFPENYSNTKDMITKEYNKQKIE